MAPHVAVRLHLALPRARWEHQHHPALPWASVPDAYRALPEGPAGDCLRFQILTVTRPAEAQGARWDEVVGDLWTIPAERMKGRRAHPVPLSPAAVDVLERQPRLVGEARIFPRNASTLQRTLRAAVPATTRHGFRSSFRDWTTVSARLLSPLKSQTVSRLFRADFPI